MWLCSILRTYFVMFFFQYNPNSIQSLLEFDSSRSWIAEHVYTPTPSPPEDSNDNLFYMGIALPRRLITIFPEPPQPSILSITDDIPKSDIETTEVDEESCSEYDADADHCRICLVCCLGKSAHKDPISEQDAKLQRIILRHAQRLANPLWYRHSLQALLRLRQLHSEKFQDTCLFSDVATRLGSGTYRMPARRFLQELFLDSTFDALYVEPSNILKLNDGNEEKPSQSPISTAPEPKLLVPSETKINGRLTFSEIEVTQLDVNQLCKTQQCNKVQEVLRNSELRSDEKLIAEILKPEERLRLSKSSDRLLKVTGTNSAISLD